MPAAAHPKQQHSAEAFWGGGEGGRREAGQGRIGGGGGGGLPHARLPHMLTPPTPPLTPACLPWWCAVAHLSAARSVGCKFVYGDGTGASAKETYLGDMPHEECAAAVRAKVPSANGATVSKKPRTSKGNPGCWAEEGITGVTNPAGSYMSCMFEEEAPPTASKHHTTSIKAKADSDVSSLPSPSLPPPPPSANVASAQTRIPGFPTTPRPCLHRRRTSSRRRLS